MLLSVPLATVSPLAERSWDVVMCRTRQSSGDGFTVKLMVLHVGPVALGSKGSRSTTSNANHCSRFSTGWYVSPFSCTGVSRDHLLFTSPRISGHCALTC